MTPQELYWEAAQAARNTFIGAAYIENSPWAELDIDVKMKWYNVAKAVALSLHSNSSKLSRPAR